MRVDHLQMMENQMEQTSSKGNQNKWFYENVWYKEDGLGYEALAEVLISRLLKKTNVDFFVEYEYEELERNGKLFHGCRSANFMTEEDDKVISVERLFRSYKKEGAARSAVKYADTEERIRHIAKTVEEITGLEHFGSYLRKTLTVDTLFLNEDRHFHNLAVIQKKDGRFRKCPIFDNGAGLFSDVRGDYPLDMDLETCYGKIQAKPFSVDFDEQLDACEILFGNCTFKAWFTMKDVEAVLQEFQGIYQDKILERVRNVMRMQMRKYAYLFYEG